MEKIKTRNEEVLIELFEDVGKKYGKRVRKYRRKRYLKSLLSFIIILASVFAISYFGMIGIVEEVERQNCESYQAYLQEYPGSALSQVSKERCDLLEFNL